MSYESLVLKLQAQAELQSFSERIRQRVERRVSASGVPPEGAFGRLFEAIGRFLEELFSGCRGGNLFDNVQKAARKKRWRQRIIDDMVAHTNGDISEEGAAAVIDEAIETPKAEFDELDSIQYRIELASKDG